MKIYATQNGPEVRAALVDAVARIYAAAIGESTVGSAEVMRTKARCDVHDFLALMDEISE